MLKVINLALVKKSKNFALDTLFPINCLSCQQEGFWFCEECLKQIEILNVQICPFCENNITPGGFACPACRKLSRESLNALAVAASYENETVKKLVHNFKYSFVSDLSEPLAKILVKSIIKNNFPVPDFIVPVPLHPRRLRWRGFNQSQLLAEKISEELTPPIKVEILDILERKKHNTPQMKIKNYQERMENVRNIFTIKKELNPPSEVKLLNKTILLIDDIATTGATIFECARVLKENGAKKVLGAVIARQTMKLNT